MESRMNSLQGGFFRGVVHNTNLLPPSDNLKLVLMEASILGLTEEPLRKAMQNKVSQIAGVFQKMIFESCTLYHIMPFAKIIGPVEKKVTKS